jgi:hypothetical protein
MKLRPEEVFPPISTQTPTSSAVKIKLVPRKARTFSGLETILKTNRNLLVKRLLLGGIVKFRMTRMVVIFAQNELVAPTVLEALLPRMACIRLRRILRLHPYRNSRLVLASRPHSTIAIDRIPTPTRACLHSLTSAAMYAHNQSRPTLFTIR